MCIQFLLVAIEFAPAECVIRAQSAEARQANHIHRLAPDNLYTFLVEKTCEAINAVVGLKGPEARLTVTSVLIVHQNRGPVSGSHIFAMLTSWMLVAGFAWVNITSFLYSC